MFRLKEFLASSVSVLLIALTLSQSVQAQSTQKGVKNIVLVHGAFADGSSWSKVIPMLQAKGFNVVAVQMPLSGLEDDVAVTKRAIAKMDGPVLLAGHSWAGVVITEAGNDPKVAGLLYISGLVPNDGQSAADLGKGYPAPPGGAEFQEDASGFLSLSLKGMNEDFVQDLSPEERKIVYATQGPWAKKALTDKISTAAWKTKPSWVIIDTQDRMINPDQQRDQAKMMKATTLELNSSHVAMLSHPKNVADFIITAAQNISTQDKGVAAGGK